MNILLFDGYLRENGKTAVLSDALFAAMRERDWQVDAIGLRDRNISDCHDCGKCAEDGVCAIDDDMTAIYEKLDGADAVVMTTPIYMWHCTALLKAFIDRLYCVTDKLSEKKLALVITAGGNAFDGAHLFVSSMQMFAEYCGMELAGTLYRAPAGEPADWDETRLKTEINELCDALL